MTDRTMARLFSSLCAATLALSAAGCQEQQARDALGIHHAPIVNGSVETGWSGVGALTMTLPIYGYQGSFCTGTLIDARWVLTAAHCLTEHDGVELSPMLVSFMVGNDARPNQSGQPTSGTAYRADAFYIHEGFNSASLDNDIALVHLAQPATGVPTYSVNTSFLNHVGEKAFYVGFGATEGVDESGGGLKRSTNVEITWIYDDAYTSEYEGSGTCFGDSGGPAFLDIGGGGDVIIGVNSSLVSCNPGVDPSCPADPCHRPAIATRVDVHASWIAGITNSPPPTCTQNAAMCACSGACQSNGQCNNAACQTESCEATWDCLVACEDDVQCQNSCYNHATDAGQAKLQAVFDCIGAHCDELEGDAYSRCVGNNCSAQTEACFPIGTGPQACRVVYGCIVDCDDNDDDCPLACYEQGTSAAQDAYDALVGCLNDQCGSVPDDQFQQCASDKCRAPIDACLPTLTGDLSCDEMSDCIDACANNDEDCPFACFETGTSSAQDAYIAIGDCVEQKCANTSGAAYSECLQSNCGGQLDACYPPANCPITGGGCPTGEACFPTLTGATDCFPSNGKALGASCQVLESVLDCGDGAVCADGTCETLCKQDRHCPAGSACELGLFTDPADIGLCGCEDSDRDGSCADVDCQDNDAASYPGAAEACGDDVDNNCDGATDEGCAGCVDGDGDGYCEGVDCDDGDDQISPAAGERCNDNIDNDCDGGTDEECASCVDADGDGFCAQDDCRDNDATSYPGAVEACSDGIDNNCDGQPDDGCPGMPGGPPRAKKSSGSCSGGGGAGGTGLLVAFALLALAVWRRRERGGANAPTSDERAFVG